MSLIDWFGWVWKDLLDSVEWRSGDEWGFLVQTLFLTIRSFRRLERISFNLPKCFWIV